MAPTSWNVVVHCPFYYVIKALQNNHECVIQLIIMLLYSLFFPSDYQNFTCFFLIIMLFKLLI